MADDTKVTRIKAKDSAKKASGESKSKKAVKKTQKVEKPESKNPFVRGFRSFIGYFKGAWYELRQVRWPSRRATWELTLAVILFSAFFVGLIVLLDLAFQSLFELLIGN